MIKNALFTSLIASTNALSQTTLDKLKDPAAPLSNAELSFVGLNFDGPFWTSWSDDYGCENLISRADLCAYPGRYKLRKTRYKECIYPDSRNYPMRILDPNSPNYFKYRTILGGTDDQIRNDYVNFIQSKPQFSIQSPAGDMDDSMEVRYAATKSFYKNTGIKCGTDDFSKNCQAPSVATECDPRIAEYAKQNGISEEDAVALWEIQETDSRWGNEWSAYPRNPIRRAIPEIKINERADTICDDRCPIPLPFTASNCKCETGSSFRGSESEAVDRSCDCDESPVRAQLCFDPDLSDDVDCESVGIDMLRKFPDECIVNPNPLISESTSSYVSYTTTNNPFTAHLLEDWYNNMPRFSRQQNLYSMSDWISTDDIDTPWRGLRVRADAAEKLKANSGLNSIRNAISNLIEGSNSQIRVNVQRLKTLLITENLVDVREVTTDPSPVSKFMTNFAASTRKDSRVDGSANRMYDFSDDLKFNWGQACDKNNPDEIITISKATLYLTDTKYADNRETILIDIPSTNIQEDKIEAVVRFIKQNISPMQVGIQQNTCNFVSATLGEWTEWSSCSQQCGGRSDRFRTCTTNTGQIFTWNGNWVDQDGNSPSSCYCTETGGESRACVEKCTYSEWSEWGLCLLKGDARPCRNPDDDTFGKQRRSRTLLCGDESRCCGDDDFKDCFVPECPGWTSWGEWSCCSKSCGAADEIGTRVRTRGCKGDDIGSEACPCGVSFDSPDSIFSNTCIDRSSNCENALTTSDNLGFLQTALCNPEKECPKLSEWSDWSSCDCGTETEFREKTCVNALFSLGRIPECMGDGNFYEERSCSDSCNRRKREVPDFWAEWSECPCGSGNARTRSGIVNGIDMNQTEKCPVTKCSSVSEWSEWSTCSEACAQRDGVERRVRNCLHSHSSECKANLLEERPCASVPDCPKWGQWSTWYDDCAISNRLIRMRTCSGTVAALPHECSVNDDVEYISCSNRL